MLLSELVKNYSIDTISQKTNISVEVLEDLINQNWEKLQKTKVNGFLNIIEREFEVDLSEIKDEAKEYYTSHAKSEPIRPIDLVDSQSVGGNGGKIIVNILSILIIGLVAYAGWFYLAKSKGSTTLKDNNSSSGMFQDSINAAKELIGIVDKNETTKTSKSNEKEQKVIKKESKKLKKNSNLNEISAKKAISNKANEEKVIKKFDITIAKPKDNSNKELNNSDIKLENTPKSVDNNSVSEIKKSVEFLLEENNTLNSEKNSTKDENITISNNNLDAKEVEKNITVTYDLNTTSLNTLNSITITPTVNKIWIGIYNLKSKKRVVKVATKAYTYNANGGVAIVTGHGMFKIKTDTDSKEFNSKIKKEYLLVTKDGIKILTKDEYKNITNKKAW